MGNSSYFCTFCNKSRRFKFIDEDHKGLVDTAPNGLVTYSDIHICMDGLSSVNNLSVDADFNIRSFERLKLPEIKIKGLGVPKPKQQISHYVEIKQTPRDLNLHLVIADKMVQTIIKIGRFDNKSLLPISKIVSDLGFVELEIYPTGESFTPEIEQWLTIFVSVIEILPPSMLGLIMEAFRYIAINKNRVPSNFDRNFIQTILASHEVYFRLHDENLVQKLNEKYNQIITEEDFEHIERFIRILKENSTSSIRNFTSNPRINMDLISLIYLFNILEDEGIILVERPGIIEKLN